MLHKQENIEPMLGQDLCTVPWNLEGENEWQTFEKKNERQMYGSQSTQALLSYK